MYVDDDAEVKDGDEDFVLRFEGWREKRDGLMSDGESSPPASFRLISTSQQYQP